MHTPGPWWFEDRREQPANAGGGGVLILGRHAGEGSSFCVASLNHRHELAAVLPNARLLAAAPEMRDALVTLVGHSGYDAAGVSDDYEFLLTVKAKDYRAARALVAKVSQQQGTPHAQGQQNEGAES